ncbi:MAG: LysM peptidoglycan-binding domain-containing protein [Actinobacteria bacterium]|nr:LysM peptidoglycan-binding domain-containing protein [Actinomycetota bacterium]
MRRGESLWRIAARRLGAGASDAKIAALVDALWRINGDKIATGDPDLIHPGQHLRMPST